jgi:integrase
MTKALTAKAVERAKPGPKVREIADGLYGGLYLCIQVSGTKSWVYRYRIKYGKTVKTAKLTLGRFPKISLASAHKLAAEAELKLRLGKDPAKAEEDRPVFGDCVDKFFRGRQGKAGDAELYRGLRFDCSDWWDLPLADISHGTIRERLDEIRARSKAGSASTARKIYAGLKGVFQLAVESGTLDINPVKLLTIPPNSAAHERDRTLDDNELIAVWKAAEATGGPYGQIIRLLILTGARRDEIANARVEWLDLDRGTLTIPKGSMKTRASHVIYLTPLMRGILAECSSSGFLFATNSGAPFTDWSGAKQRLDKLSGVTSWRQHDLRRTAKTGWQKLRWRDANGNICRIPYDVRQLMSAHAVAGVVGIYERDNLPEECKAGFAAWSARVQALVTPTPNVVSLFG